MRSIVAIATGAGGNAGVGIVRMSGDEAYRIARSVFRVKGEIPDFVPNRMTLGTIAGNTFNEQAFCVYFKAPLSYTGEDVVEFHCHGGKAVLAAVVRLLTDEGAFPAARGEFTKRAFLNGKMTLDHAEGVLSMIEAESRAELSQSSRLMNGELAREIGGIRELLLTATANLEVVLDYPEETEEVLKDETMELLKRAQAELSDASKKAKLGRLIREGAKVAIVGKPNAGKSSLLNAILKEDRAIVTEIAGTTRDTLEGTTELNGVKVTFVDTAGLRETNDTVERLGVERALRAEAEADLVLRVVDLTEEASDTADECREKTIVVGNKTDVAERRTAAVWPSAPTPTPRPQGAGNADAESLRIRSDERSTDNSNPSKETAIKKPQNLLNETETKSLKILSGVTDTNSLPFEANANGLQNTNERAGEGESRPRPNDAALMIEVSAKTGEGIDRLLFEIANRLDFFSAETASVITNERHRAAVDLAFRATENAISGYENNTIDCILVDLKQAYRALGEIVGADVSETLVDKIFENFCVGK